MKKALKIFTGIALLITLAACGGGSSGSPSNTSPAELDDTSSVRAALPLTAPDPSAADQQPFSELVDTDYTFDRITVTDPIGDRTYETDVHGYVRYAKDAPTPMPVIALMHGRHQTCETTAGQAPVLLADDDSCPNNAAITPAMSYRGYDYLADALAAAGYFVLSIDANDINDSDGSPNSGDAGANARARLMQQHLDEFRTINNTGSTAGGNTLFAGLQDTLDMSRIGIMGHSRGGDGIARYVTYNRNQADPHSIVAAFALAPTDYNREFVDNVPFAVLLPYCDGDVEDLQGAFTFDDSRYFDPTDPMPKFQILTMGGNHNYFNRIWTSDDWTITDPSSTDPFCGTNTLTNERDSVAEQEGYGLFFMGSFFRAFVGQEPEYLTYWNGQAEVSDSACPDFTGPCENRHHLTVHSGASQRQLIEDFRDLEIPSLNDQNGAITFTGFSEIGTCDPAGFADDTDNPCPSDPTFSTTEQLFVRWAAPASITTTLTTTDLTPFDVISLRVGVMLDDTANADGQDFSLTLTDSNGTSETIIMGDFSQSLYFPPGRDFNDSQGGSAKTVLNAVDIPLLAFTLVDLSDINTLQLGFDQTQAGSIQLADWLLLRVQ